MQPSHHAITTYLVGPVITAAAYWGLLGWDTEKTPGADGTLHGPYQAWQVLTLVGVIAGVAVWLGRRHHPIGPALLVAIALAVCEAVSGSRDPNNDGLWPVGVMVMLVGSFVGIALVAAVTQSVGDRLTPH